MTSIKRRGAVEAQDLASSRLGMESLMPSRMGPFGGTTAKAQNRSSSQTAVLVHKRNHISDSSCVEVGGAELVSELNKTGTASRREGFACAEAKMDTSLLFGYTSHAF